MKKKKKYVSQPSLDINKSVYMAQFLAFLANRASATQPIN